MKDMTLALALAELRTEEIRAVFEVAGGVSPRQAGPGWRSARRKLRAVLADEAPRGSRRRAK